VNRAFISRFVAPLFPLAAALLPTSCGGSTGDAADAGDIDVTPPPKGAFCALPGSVIWTEQGHGEVAGGPSPVDLSWLNLPPNFCAHYYATVPDVRQLRVAPGGELFATSPTAQTTGGNYIEGKANVFVLPDDNRDGVADQTSEFVSHPPGTAGPLPNTQGLLFANGNFYFQDGPTLQGLAYKAGDRQMSGTPQAVTTITAPQDMLHWSKVMDVAADGTMYITNGGSQGDACLQGDPVRGAIFKLNPDGSTTLVAKGFRNPIALRCESNHDVCLAAELAWDYSGDKGGREKLVPVRPGDDWGYPCCATQNLPYTGVTYANGATPDCSGVAPESDGFVIGHTPFGLDFETGKWPSPYNDRVYVTLHGVAGTWEGARVVGIALDPATGLPMTASELQPTSNSNAMLPFASGWDDNKQDHGRPAAVTFAPDGRMFLGDDNRGLIIWIAPVGLMQK
jgi:glucose/arabinose dehydrogenase